MIGATRRILLMNFSYKQLKAIELLARGDLNIGEVVEEVGINPSTMTRWRTKPEFMHAIMMRARQMMKEDLPEVYRSLSDRSKMGNAQHIKIMLDHIEKLEETKANQTSITFTWKGTEDEDK
jgi:transposase-like protein